MLVQEHDSKDLTMDAEAFTDMMRMMSVGVLFWLMGWIDFSKGYPIKIPTWLAILCGRRHRPVYLRPFAVQILGLMTIAWSMIVALLFDSHAERIDLFAKGLFVFLVFAGSVVLIVAWRNRQQKT